jgi:hypothetical protein
MLYKFKTIFIIFGFLSISNTIFGQKNYSIDIEKRKNRKIPISFVIKQTKSNLQNNFKNRRKLYLQNKVSRKTENHTYNIQSMKVKKRMKRSKRIAENHNKGSVPLDIKIKKYLKKVF